MPTVFSHPAVPLALRVGLGREIVSPRLLLAGMLASVLPDLDVMTLRLGMEYPQALGHRGFSHSLLFAALVALAGAAAHRALHCRFGRAVGFLFVSTASHGLLDAFTNGGIGIAFLWPWSEVRSFAPEALRVIEVSPISVSRFLSWRGVEVLFSELCWIWLPAAAACLVVAGARRRGHGGPRQSPRRERTST